jgi:predicted Zn-dependent protease
MDLAIQGAGELTNRTLAGSNEKSQPEADQLGIQYAWNAGYDPMGFTSFLDSLASRSDYFQTSKILQTKPALSDRVLDAFTEIEYLPGKENYADSSAEFRAIQTLLQP